MNERHTKDESKLKAATGLVLAVLLVLSLVEISVAQQSPSERTQPRLRVRVERTDDRWITFGDGNQVRHGWEVSPLLDYHLFQSDAFVVQYVPQQLVEAKQGFASLQSLDIESMLSERIGQELSGDLLTSLRQRSGSRTAASELLHVIVRPRVETFLYSSGQRSNRLVYGFSPDRLDPFNEGRPGAIDNEFVARADVTKPICKSVDLLNGQIQSVGYGPWSGNYGANFDEGAEFFIAGYGVGFRFKKFTVKSEIVFDLEFPELGTKTSLRQVVSGGGTDVMVAASYQGIYGAVEVQRRKTLQKALKELLPKLVQEVRSHLEKTAWSTRVVQARGSEILVLGGFAEGLTEGALLHTESGESIQLVQIGEGISVGTTSSLGGIPVGARLYASPPTLRKSGPLGALESLTSSEQRQELQLKLLENISTEQHAATALVDAGKCPTVKKPSFFERILNSAFLAYGFYRYFQVLDQPFKTPVGALSGGTRKIAMVSTGISPKEKKLESLLDPNGFDFLSWDNRPADDVGAGTAEALHLIERLEVQAKLVPIRVIGPFGTTHSSAIYQALLHLSTRSDIDAVIIPFAPTFESKALSMGVEKLARAGKSVFVATDLQGAVGSRILKIPPSDADKEKSVFGTKGRVSPTARGVIEGAAKWMNQNWKQSH